MVHEKLILADNILTAHTGFGVFLFLAGGTAVLIWLLRATKPQARVPVHPKIKKTLQAYCAYYQRLPFKDKIIFQRRVQQFILLKRFVPREMPKVTLEMKVLIAASAIQLTFGLSKVFLKHFRTILVYPDTYYSIISRKFHKGEVNPAFGVIVLSWKNFLEGYINPSDSFNLGLHEMAHALRLENIIKNAEYSFLEPDLLDKWAVFSRDEMYKIKEGQSHFFRKYAAVDEEEFFAIAIENFFEQPQQFYNELPHLYKVLTKILNQNPLLLLQE